MKILEGNIWNGEARGVEEEEEDVKLYMFGGVEV